MPAVAQPPQVVPFKAAQVILALIGTWPFPLQQLQDTPDLSAFPGLLGQVHLGAIEPAAGESLLGFGLSLLLGRLLALLFGRRRILFRKAFLEPGRLERLLFLVQRRDLLSQGLTFILERQLFRGA